jgi:polysaccharide export outer membrane protein
MKIRIIVFTIFFLGFCLAVSEQKHLLANPLLSKEFVIGAEDVVEVRVWKNEDLDRTLQVSNEGAVTLPLVGKVQAAGLSVFEFQTLVEKKLARSYIVSPQVSVRLLEIRSKKVFVLGEVNEPGSYKIKGSTHLLEVISEAGGFTENAGRVVTIMRPKVSAKKNAPISKNKLTHGKIIQVDLMDQLTLTGQSKNLIIYGGESIFVDKMARIFVTGEVKKPGEIKWEKGLTIRQAISLAGGITRRGAPKRTKLIRTENGTEQMIKPKMTDSVRPNDIIRIPESYF